MWVAQIQIKNSKKHQLKIFIIGGKGNAQGQFGEQTQLSLIYAQYKVGEYYKALDISERFVRAYPNSAHTDYVFYLAALSNARLGDNFIQDFFGVNRASRSR